jgi:hypothetical protein
MQSIEILIVIVLIQYHATALQGQAAARCGPSASRSTRFKMTVCKRGLQPMKKEKAMLRRLYTTRRTAYLCPTKASITRRFWFSGLYDHDKSR